jgi:predicted dehydrogenase
MCAYNHIPDAKVVAVSDVNITKAKAFAQRHNIQRTFESYTDLLELKNLDYVDICTPTSTHAEIACDAAKSGQQILLEKPMARTTLDCDKIIDAASKQKVKACVCHNQLFIPQVLQARNMVEAGGFDLTYFRVSVKESAKLIGAPSWTLTPEQGGVIWETGCHSAYLQLGFLRNIDRVMAIGDKAGTSVYHRFAVLLDTPNQSLGVIDVSWLAERSEIVFEMMSSKGERIQILDYDHLVKIPKTRPKGILKGFYHDQKTVLKKWYTVARRSMGNRSLLKCLPHYNLVSSYIQSLKEDTQPPVTLQEGRMTIQLLEGIESSLDTGKPVKLEKEPQ